jgi:hypothetical protein
MGVPGQTPASATAGRVCELKTKGDEKGEDTLDKRLAIVKQTKVSGFVLEINGDRRFSRVGLEGLGMGHPQHRWSLPLRGHQGVLPCNIK